MRFAVGLPVRDLEGNIRCFAVVDALDFPKLSKHRWHINNRGSGLISRQEGPQYWRAHRYLHREVMGLEPDDPRRIDHINRDTLDNRRANLRIATTAENAQNQGSRGGCSRYRGVSWDKSRGKWMASHTLNGHRTTIGRYDLEAEAGQAAANWRALHMPFSAEAAANRSVEPNLDGEAIQ